MNEENVKPPAPATSPGATGSADLEMMTEWAASLCSRLDTIDLRHAEIGVEWFYSFAKSKIKRAEELRSIESVSKLTPPNTKLTDPAL